jgi:hypothetical protein
VLFNDGWRLIRNDPQGASGLSYEEAKPWILPTGNALIADPARRYARPVGNVGQGVSYAASDFDDGAWRPVTLPHDYAVEGPFTNTGDRRDLSFITAGVVDAQGRLVPNADNTIRFAVSGPGELVATDNGNPMDRTVFVSPERDAFSGLALAIVRAEPGRAGGITVTATSRGPAGAEIVIAAE